MTALKGAVASVTRLVGLSDEGQPVRGLFVAGSRACTHGGRCRGCSCGPRSVLTWTRTGFFTVSSSAVPSALLGVGPSASRMPRCVCFCSKGGLAGRPVTVAAALTGGRPLALSCCRTSGLGALDFRWRARVCFLFISGINSGFASPLDFLLNHPALYTGFWGSLFSSPSPLFPCRRL